MSMNGKTAEQMQEEFYESLRREQAAREAWARKREEEYRREKKARDEEYRREKEARDEEYRREKEARQAWAREREEEYRREKEAREESQRLFEKRVEQSRKERDEEWKRITGEWGGFTNDEGGMVEYEGALALRELSEIGGMLVDEVVGPLQLNKKGREYDGIIQCPDAVILLEFKRRLTRAAVQKFVDQQLSGFLGDFPGMVNGRAYYGAVVGASVDAAAEALARKNGLFVIRIPANRKVQILNNKAKMLAREKIAPKAPAIKTRPAR